jgi:hypothetical protein
MAKSSTGWNTSLTTNTGVDNADQASQGRAEVILDGSIVVKAEGAAGVIPKFPRHRLALI